MKSSKIALAVATVLSLSGMAAHAVAQGIDDPRRADYFKTFAGQNDRLRAGHDGHRPH